MGPMMEEYYESKKFEKFKWDSLGMETAEFYDCDFIQSDFSEALVKNCRFENCRFLASDLSLAKFPGSLLLGISFENSKLIGIDWTEARKPLEIGFKKCLLDDSVFWDLDLRKIEIINSRARNAIFSGANLSRASFSGTDLTGARFQSSDLSFADFSAALNYSINPNESTLKKTRFSLPEAISLLNSLDIILK